MMERSWKLYMLYSAFWIEPLLIFSSPFIHGVITYQDAHHSCMLLACFILSTRIIPASGRHQDAHHSCMLLDGISTRIIPVSLLSSRACRFKNTAHTLQV